MDSTAPPDSILNLDQPIAQGKFADLVGVTPQSISRRVDEGVLVRGETCRQWLAAYIEALRSAASRYTSVEATALVEERTALARSQREAQELKNAVARGEYAPIGLLGDVLATASSALASRMDGFDGMLRRVAPDLPERARDALLRAVADARNEWVRATGHLVVKRLDEIDAEADREAASAEDANERASDGPRA